MPPAARQSSTHSAAAAAGLLWKHSAAGAAGGHRRQAHPLAWSSAGAREGGHARRLDECRLRGLVQTLSAWRTKTTQIVHGASEAGRHP